MFTGIIQNQGKVICASFKEKQAHFIFEWVKPFSGIQLGESISVNGVCLTVSKVESKAFHADVILQTLRATNLDRLKVGDFVNLERSLKWGETIGGHFVSGHVDGYGRVQKITHEGRNLTMTILAPAHLRKFLIPKGSIAMGGVSLTLQSVQGGSFTVGLVPHTLEETNLGKRKTGDTVNLEADLMIRYFLHLKRSDASISLETFLKAQNLEPLKTKAPSKSSKLSLSSLKSQGF
ncbi:MAG: riboflavin synthase [Candidatus Omnitrophica bacterium]|nr:riboflavin synthase [Candidatus Omnitrophota bacterium]